MDLEKKLYHYTSVESLLKILKDGKLIGKAQKENKYNFPYRCDEFIEKRPLELCLVRKAGEHLIVYNCKQNVDNIKIDLNLDNVSKLRYIKKPYSICWLNNERYINAAAIIWNTYQDNFFNYNDGQKTLKLIRKFTSVDTKQIMDDFNNNPEKIREYTRNVFNDKSEHELSIIENVLCFCIQRFYNKYNGLYRDAEERIDLSKNSIPVTSEYMKIILGTKIIRFTPEEYYQYRISNWDNFLKNGWIDQEIYNYLIKNFKDVIKDKEKILPELNALIEEYKIKDPDLFEYMD